MPCCRSRSIQYCLIYGNVRKYILQRRTGYVKSCEHIARGDTFIYYFRTRYPNFYCFGEITKSEICSSNLGFSIESPLLGLHCSQYRQYYFFSIINLDLHSHRVRVNQGVVQYDSLNPDVHENVHVALPQYRYTRPV